LLFLDLVFFGFLETLAYSVSFYKMRGGTVSEFTA